MSDNAALTTVDAVLEQVGEPALEALIVADYAAEAESAAEVLVEKHGASSIGRLQQ